MVLSLNLPLAGKTDIEYEVLAEEVSWVSVGPAGSWGRRRRGSRRSEAHSASLSGGTSRRQAEALAWGVDMEGRVRKQKENLAVMSFHFLPQLHL